MKYQFGFIGTGNMGGALATAVCKRIGPQDVLLSDKAISKADKLADTLGCTVSDVLTVVESCRYIFLGVKPQMMAELFEEIRPVLQKRESRFLLVTMAAGLSMDVIAGLGGGNLPVIRIMPNTPVSVGEGMILYTANPLVTEEEMEVFTEALSFAGKLDRIDEEKIDAASVISSCGPAFMFMFMKAMADAGVALGLSLEKSQLYAEQAMLGSAALALTTGESPEELKIKVCSPGGTTIEGVKSFEKNELDKIVSEAAIASYRRTLELAGK